jgi:hypothetical protein
MLVSWVLRFKSEGFNPRHKEQENDSEGVK